MAGAFGLESEHYEVSMQMAELSLLPKVRQAGPKTPVIANGTSCRHQIRDGAQRDSLHLARVLRSALAKPSSTGKLLPGEMEQYERIDRTQSRPGQEPDRK